jgi:ABC-2 type transport system permease protein
MSALRGLLLKETFHILRDRRTLVVLLALPVVQVVLFGYAIRTDVNSVRLAVVDPSPDAVTTNLRNRFAGTGVFEVVADLTRVADVEPLFQTGAAQVALVFDATFTEDLRRGSTAHLQVITDATDPNSGGLIQAYTEALIADYGRSLAPPASRIVIVPQVQMRFNPTRASSNLFVPGLMAFVLTIVSALMTAISLTREKETGTMEALLVSPLRPWEIIVGKVTPYLVIGFVGALGILVEARLVFGVPTRGSVLLLLAEVLLYILVSLSFGVLVSARTSSQRVAMMAAMLTTMLPNILLSGFIFPLESMPQPLQVLSNVVAGRWFVTIVRSIMLKGAGLELLWRETLILAVMATVLLVASTRSLRERLDD